MEQTQIVVHIHFLSCEICIECNEIIRVVFPIFYDFNIIAAGYHRMILGDHCSG